MVLTAAGLFYGFLFLLPEGKRAQGQRSDGVEAADSKELPDDSETPPAAGKWPAVFFAAIGLLVGVFAFVQYRAHTPDNLPRARSLAGFPDQIGSWQGKRSFLTEQIIGELDLTDYVQAEYRAPGAPPIDFYVAWYASQSRGESIHTPETCLRIGNWQFREGRVVKLDLDGYDASPVRLKSTILTDGSTRWLMYFWFRVRGRDLVNAYELKFFNFWDRLTRRRTDGSLIRVMTPISGAETRETAEQRLRRFLNLSLPILDTYLPD
jgi:EpsI family protein